MRGTILRPLLCGALILGSAAVFGSFDASAGTERARAIDCGVIGIPAASSSPFRVWARGTGCGSGKRLLSSEAVARGLPTSAFIPPHAFEASGFNCGYDLSTLICWVGPRSAKRLTDGTFHRAAARSDRVVSATPVEREISASTARRAAVKVIRPHAARQGKKAPASLREWIGQCALSGDAVLPGVRTWNCMLFPKQSPGSCFGQVFLYRTAARSPTTGWRWDAIGGTAVMCH